jgi:hypothetical protein
MVFSNHLVRQRECRSSRRLLITGYVWQRNGSGKMVANLQSAPVGDMGVTYVTGGGEVVLIVWKDFALS